MAPRKIAFSDAVRLLNDDTDPPGWLTRLTGAGAATVTVATLGAVDVFALRDEITRWGTRATTRLRERTQRLGRFDRTQRLVAAHSIIVVTAFYGALDEILADLPGVDLDKIELTAAEQVAIAVDGPPGKDDAAMLNWLVDTSPPMPAPHLPFEQTMRVLHEYYHVVGRRLSAFLYGLVVFERGAVAVDLITRSIGKKLSDLAVRRYEEAYRALMVQAPEFVVWAGMIDEQATRAAVTQAVTDLRAELTRHHDALHAAEDHVWTGLARQHRTRLGRPLLSSADAPPHVAMPTLEQAYVPPHGLVGVAGPTDLPATEAWWEDTSQVLDVPDFLLGHLTSPAALEQPVVVLGQPGSGKSVLTEVLAAQLPDTGFLVVRVELRKVHSDSSPQEQIEKSLYQTLGESVTWPDLVRRAHPALPVVIMDGFDELLQATGVNHSDYLTQLQEFQQREADLGRPVAVLVTSRTVVADRARFPHGTVVVRLEPFDDDQVAAWLHEWNTRNAPGLHQRGLRTLPSETAVQYGDLARQPLLLLLLALYDSGANALQNTTGSIGRTELYERLFADFIAREIDKHHAGGHPDQRQAAIAAEWRRLSAIGLAILNRGGDVISEAALDSDMHHLLVPEDWGLTELESVHRALTVAQLLVGRFFFIHQSQARRDTDAAERSFEFLHATFGEFLAARQIVQALVDLADEHSRQRRRPGAVLDAGFFHAATSFITVTRRAPLWEFCRGLLGRLGAEERARCRRLVLELLPDAGFPHPTWTLAKYEPRRKPPAARHATYSANLVCLAVLLTDGPVDTAELVDEPVVTQWRAQALLWQSQLDPEDRQVLWQALRVAWNLEAEPAVLTVRVEDSSPVSLYESLPWPSDERPTLGLAIPTDVVTSSESTLGRELRQSAFMQIAYDVREHLYGLVPYWKSFGHDITFDTDGGYVSGTAALQELLLETADPADDTSSRLHLYVTTLRLNGPDLKGPLLRQLLRDAIHLDESQIKDIIGMSAQGDERLDTDLARLMLELRQVTRGWTTPEELAKAVGMLSRQDLVKLVMSMLHP